MKSLKITFSPLQSLEENESLSKDEIEIYTLPKSIDVTIKITTTTTKKKYFNNFF